jgi:hypothetical protein
MDEEILLRLSAEVYCTIKVQVAHSAVDLKFLGHNVAQSVVRRLWYGRVRTQYRFWLLPLLLLVFPLFFVAPAAWKETDIGLNSRLSII